MHENAIANGPITNWLAIIGVISLIYWAWRLVAALMSRDRDNGGPREDAAAASAPSAARGGAPAAPAHENDIAVIAAAVFAVLGTHRIVHLEAATQEHNWAVEGRWMQQTSHRPHA